MSFQATSPGAVVSPVASRAASKSPAVLFQSRIATSKSPLVRAPANFRGWSVTGLFQMPTGFFATTADVFVVFLAAMLLLREQASTADRQGQPRRVDRRGPRDEPNAAHSGDRSR